MKKRLMSLFICAVMLFSVFTFGACFDNTELPEPEEDITTINIYGIKEEGTTDEAILAVEEALSKISYKKHRTKVNLVLFEEKEYASVIFKKVQEDMRRNNIDVEYSEKLNVASRLNAETSSSSLDIFLVYTPKSDSLVLDKNEEKYYSEPLKKAGEMYNILCEKKALLGLDKYLNNANWKALADNAYTEAINSVKKDKVTYGIPNNIVYGEYEFFVLNSEYIDRYYGGLDIETEWELSEGGNSKYTKVKEELKGKKDAGEIPEGVEIEKQFASYEEYNEYLRDGKEFCIAKVTGSLAVETLCSQSDEFDVYQGQIRKIKTEELYESMFCISSTISGTRVENAIDILILLNTNTEFRNIYQYGIKDTHYTLSRDGVAHVTGTETNTYKMNPLYGGNMFLVYPSDNMSTETKLLAENEWKLGKKQVDDVLKRYKGL